MTKKWKRILGAILLVFLLAGISATALAVNVTDHDLYDRLPIRVLREVAIVAGDDDEGLLRLNGVTKPQGHDGIAT